MDETVRARGVIEFSSGNHAQVIAHAASLFGVPSVIVMSADSPALKLANTQALGQVSSRCYLCAVVQAL